MRLWKRLLGTALCLCAAVCLMSVSASAAEHSHPICGKAHTDIGDHKGSCDDVTWIKVMQTDVTDSNGLKLEDGKSYYLGADISVEYTITIKGTVNLCLNGYSITKTSESSTFEGVIKVEPGASFTLCDCNGSGAGNGKLTHAEGKTGRGVLVGSSEPQQASFIMYGGTISGNRTNLQDGAGVRVQNASFKMYGGTISDNTAKGESGGGVAGVAGEKFIMYGGEISGNKATYGGGGVELTAVSFEMYGGSIINNNADSGVGGGVDLYNSSFTLSGGTISGNTAKEDGGGVYFSGYTTNGNTLTISDTVKIEGNSAANGGGVYIKSANLTVTGGNIIKNKATGSGGGVYVGSNNDTSFNVSGAVNITDNVVGSSPNNVYLPDGKTITVAGALTGRNQIGVTTENLPDDSNYVRIASGNKDNALPDKFRYENDSTIAVSAVVNSGTATLVACKHNWSGAWEKDTYNHWHVCSICQGKSEGSAHTYDQKKTEGSYKASDATCTSPALYYMSCVCGAEGADTFESGEINPDKHSGVLGDWQSNEDKHWKEYPCCHVHMEEESHHWGAGEVTTAATCKTVGVKTFTCSGCNRTKTEAIEALKHDWGDPSYVWNGTSCTAERICARDRSHKETETVTAAVTVTQHQSCLLDELSTYTASFQNAAFAPQTQKNVVTANKLGHNFENGTWQSDGDYHWKKCSRCVVTNEANKAPHNWDTGVIKTQPTCTVPGEKTYTCVCSATRTETVSATGHNWSDAWMHDDTHHWHNCKNANCPVTENSEKSGYAEHSGGAANCTKQAVCVTCGTAYGALDPNGHDWGAWAVTTPATTSAAGEEKRVCQRNASHTETRAIPKLTPAPSGGGSGSGSSSAPAISVPVSGSGDTVHVSASVSGSTAEVKEIKSAELDKIGTDSAVVIDLSGLNKGVTGVTLSTDTIDSICKTEADGVTVKLPSAELRVDRQTLAAVTEQAAGSKIRLVVEPDSTARGTMTAAQKSTLAGMKNAAVLEAYFVSDGTRIHDFKGGSVELSIPYRADGAIRAWFLKEDGTREPVSARYDKENAQLILRHFSHYVIEELDSSAAYTVCAKDDSCPIWLFADAAPTAWYHDGVHYCIENGLMQGVSTASFLPNGSTTRAQLVTILWRLEGNPAPVSAADFSDIADGAWYSGAIRWAADSGVVKGYDNGRFGPNDAVTREQMAAILYRYAQHKGYDVSAGNDTNILSFNDALTISGYSIPAMQWACGSGMVHGIAQKGGMLLAPRDTTTRAQTATLLMRFQIAFAKEP